MRVAELKVDRLEYKVSLELSDDGRVTGLRLWTVGMEVVLRDDAASIYRLLSSLADAVAGHFDGAPPATFDDPQCASLLKSRWLAWSASREKQGHILVEPIWEPADGVEGPKFCVTSRIAYHDLRQLLEYGDACYRWGHAAAMSSVDGEALSKARKFDKLCETLNKIAFGEK